MSPSHAILAKAALLLEAGKRDEAIAQLRRVLNKDPTDLECCQMLCGQLIAAGAGVQAQFVASQTAQARRADPYAQLNEAAVMSRTGRVPEAIKAIERARDMAPQDLHVQRQVVGHYIIAGRPDLALALARPLWEAHKSDDDAMGMLVDTYVTLAMMDEAVEAVREVLGLIGPDPELTRWLCLHANYSHLITPDDLFRIHTDAGRSIAAAAPSATRPFTLDRNPDRRLRVAYISQDFRNRSAAHFFEPILRAHDRGSIEPFLYYALDQQDAMTRTLGSLGAGLTFVSRLSDAALAERMRQDRIDIAVDLTGHTGGNRLAAFAHAPAPVTITYMGYANTTGLPGMQNRIVDSITDPPGSDRWATERLIRIDPCFLCYAPPPHAPPIAPPREGPVTFGTFNSMMKITPPVLDLWSRLAAAVSSSHFLIKNHHLAAPAMQDRLRADLARRGIQPERITISGELPSPAEHLAAYSRMDIALDPFPYNGTTTTVEALLMGVPVVTLLGESHRARVSASILRAVGHPEFIAKDPDEYIRIACDLAADRPRLAALRGSLRAELLASPLCDAPTFTRKLETIYRDLWRDWCAAPVS